MRYQWVLFRIIFGLTFVLSGVVKLIDPTGTSLIVQEYSMRCTWAHCLFYAHLSGYCFHWLSL